MSDRGASEADVRRSWSLALAVAVGVVGVLMAHYPMIFSGLGRVQVDLGDSRLVNYLLEHNYQWYRGDPLHREFWNPPVFYPARNIAAYSDTMLGIAPIYGAYRVIGFAADTSFQLWTITLSILNYAVMLHFARRRIKLSIPAASAAAFLFAFGSPRINMLIQQPQLTQFLSLITIDALFGLFTDREGSMGKRLALWMFATAGLLAQLTSGFYLGWFTVLSLGLAAIVALWMPTTRLPFLAALWRDALAIVLCAVLGSLVMRPWLVHHLSASHELGPRFIPWVSLLQPHPSTWLYMGSDNWLANWTARLTGFSGFAVTNRDSALGVGLTTTFVGLAGLYLGRDRRSIRLVTMVAFLLFLCITHLPVNLLFLVKYAVILVPITLAYDGRDEAPGVFVLTVGILLILLNSKVNPNVYLLGCGFYTLLLTIAAFLRWEDDDRPRLMPSALIVGLSYTLIPSSLILGIGIVCGGIVAGASYRLGGRSRRWLEAMGFLGFWLFVGLTTFWDRPGVLLFGLAAILTIIGTALWPFRPTAAGLVKAVFLGLVIAVVYEDHGTAWHYLFLHVPGAKSLLFVSRIGLMMLIPWAIGVGYAIDALLSRKRPILALGIGMVCLMEQGVATSSYDKYANRAVVEAISKRIDPGSETFYYSPRDAEYPPFKANVDAMWAGLETGKPSINGYSGHTPLGWRDLEDSNVTGPRTLQLLQSALDAWREKHGHAVKSVQWIGGPEDPPLNKP